MFNGPISEDFVKKIHTNHSTGFHENDIAMLLLQAGNSEEQFNLFLKWFVSYMKLVEVPLPHLAILFNTILVNRDANLNLQRYSNISLAGNLIESDEIFNRLNGNEDHIAKFHYDLFEEKISSQTAFDFEDLLTDINQIQIYISKSIDHEHVDLVKDFISWKSNYLLAHEIDDQYLTDLLSTFWLFGTPKARSILKNASDAIRLSQEKEIHHRSKEKLATLIVDQHIRILKFIDDHAQEKSREKLLNECENHIEFLNQSLRLNSELLFVDYCNWLVSRLTSYGWQIQSITRLLASCRSILRRSHLSDGIQLLDIGIRKVSSLNKVKSIDQSVLTSDLSKIYLDHLLEGKRNAATDYVLSQVDAGVSIQDIYINVFQETQYEIGRLWEKNKISVAQEHYCTATTEMIMSVLYPHIKSATPNGKKALACCVGSDLHEIGVRMVADFLSMDGWEAFYLGANVPTEAIIAAINEYKVDLLALSASLTPHIKMAQEVILSVRESHPGVKIIVGGSPFNKDPKLWKTIGADGGSPSAKEVHQRAMRLVS